MYNCSTIKEGLIPAIKVMSVVMTIMITRMPVTITMTPITPYQRKGKKNNNTKQ